MLVELERLSLWISFQSSGCLFELHRQVNFELHISSLEQMLLYLAAAGHNKHTFAIWKYLQDIKILCPCLENKYKKGSFTIDRNDKLFWSGTFYDQVTEQTLMQSSKFQEGLINITYNNAAQTKWLLLSHIVANYTDGDVNREYMIEVGGKF